MHGAVNSMSGIGKTGSPSGSLVNCEMCCEFRASATSVGHSRGFHLISGLVYYSGRISSVLCMSRTSWGYHLY